MIRCRRAVLAIACCLFAPAATNAAPGQFPFPVPWSSTFPSRIPLVGHGPVGADSAWGHFEAVIRDQYGQPFANATVICEIAPGSDFRIASDQLNPRLRVVCAHQTVYTLSDGNGVASFTIIGGGRQPLPPPGSANTVLWSVDGQSFASGTCFAFDLNGADGVSLADASLWAVGFFSDLHPARLDFDGDGRVALADLSILAAVYFGMGSSQSAAAYCP